MRKMLAIQALVLCLVSGAPHSAGADDNLTTAGITFGAPSSLGVFVDERVGLSGGEILAFRAQAGIGGGELSAGIWAVETLVGLRGAVVRTWGRPVGIEPGRTLVGASLEIGLPFASVHLGALQPVAGGRARATCFTWGLSIGIPINLDFTLI
jgi:hypothetical protein